MEESFFNRFKQPDYETEHESDDEIQDTEDLHGFKISKWDRVCELLFEKEGRKFNLVIQADDYQEAIQRNKKAQLIKCAYFAAGDYLEGNDPQWIEKGGEREWER